MRNLKISKIASIFLQNGGIGILFPIKINPLQCILCGQYILADDRLLMNNGYLVEHEILSNFGCQFPSKRSFKKSITIKFQICLNLTLKWQH